MIIAHEDVERMKELAQKVSKTSDPIRIHQMEHGFIDFMTVRYGKKEAIRMLSKVWTLSAKIKAQP